MRVVLLIARLLLGLIFVVFGLNGFLNFLSLGSVPSGLAGQFIGALFLSHYWSLLWASPTLLGDIRAAGVISLKQMVNSHIG